MKKKRGFDNAEITLTFCSFLIINYNKNMIHTKYDMHLIFTPEKRLNIFICYVQN